MKLVGKLLSAEAVALLEGLPVSSLFFLMIFPASLVRVLLICLVVAMVWQNKQLVQELPGSPLTSGTALLLRIF